MKIASDSEILGREREREGERKGEEGIGRGCEKERVWGTERRRDRDK